MIPYIISNFRGGFSDENSRGIAGSFKYGHSLDIHKRDDTLICKQTMAVSLSETVGMGVYGGTLMTGGVINVFLSASDGSLYAFSERGSIFCRSNEGVWTFVYNDEAGKITGAAEWEDSAFNRYLYWATGSQISRKPFPGANSAPDTATMRWTDVSNEYKVEFISSAASWHTMRTVAGALHIANSEYLAKVDFDGSFDPGVMNINPLNKINCLEEMNDYVVLGSEKSDDSEEGHLWNWVLSSAGYVQKKKYPIQGVNALIYTEFPLLQGGDNGELFLADLANVVPLASIPGKGRANPYGVDILEDLAVFGIYGSTCAYPGIWSYGRRNKNRPPCLNYEYRLVGTVGGSTISTIGAIIVADSVLYASWGSNEANSDNQYGIDQISNTTKATAVYEGLEFNGGAPHLQKKFDTVKVVMSPMPASTSISIKFKLNKDTSWKYAVLGNRSTTFTQTNATAAIFSINRQAEVYEIGAELNPSGDTTPEILSITTYLSNSNNEF